MKFTGEFGSGWEVGSDVPAGPKELWETLEDPPAANRWPEPEADYEALGYPETRVYLDDLDTVAQREKSCQRLIMPRAVEFDADGLSLNWSVRITNNETTPITVDDDASD